MAKEEVKDTQVHGDQMPYEEVVKYAQQLSQQRNYYEKQAQLLTEKVKERSDFSVFKRLDYLFKVVENKDSFSTEFVAGCIKEIEAIMTIPEEQPQENKEKQE